MSFWKQAVLCLVLVVAAAGGWYAYKNPDRRRGWPSQEPRRSGGRPEAAGRRNRIPGLIGGGAVNVVTAPVEMDKSGDTVMALGTAKAASLRDPLSSGHRRRDRRSRSRPARRSRPTRRS